MFNFYFSPPCTEPGISGPPNRWDMFGLFVWGFGEMFGRFGGRQVCSGLFGRLLERCWGLFWREQYPQKINTKKLHKFTESYWTPSWLIGWVMVGSKSSGGLVGTTLSYHRLTPTWSCQILTKKQYKLTSKPMNGSCETSIVTIFDFAGQSCLQQLWLAADLMALVGLNSSRMLAAFIPSWYHVRASSSCGVMTKKTN